VVAEQPSLASQVWNDKNLRQEILAFNTAYWMSYEFINLWRVNYQNAPDCEHCDGKKAYSNCYFRWVHPPDMVRPRLICRQCYFELMARRPDGMVLYRTHIM